MTACALLRAAMVLLVFSCSALADQLLPSQTQPDEFSIATCRDEIVLENVRSAIEQQLKRQVAVKAAACGALRRTQARSAAGSA